MVYSAFGSNRPLVMGFLIIPAAVFVGIGFFTYDFPEYNLAGPLSDLFISLLDPFPQLRILLGMILILTNAILLNIIYNGNDLAQSENYFPSLLFFFFAVLDLRAIDVHPILLSTLFILLALRRLLALYRSERSLSIGFDSGFFLGVSILFFPPSVLVLPLIWIGFIRTRAFNLREWVVPITGLLAVGIYAFSYYFIGNYEFDPSEFFTPGKLLSEIPDGNKRLAIIWMAAVTILLMGLGLFFFFLEISKSTLRKKNTKYVFLWGSLLLLMEFFAVSFLAGDSKGLWLITAVPVAVYGGFYFSHKGRRKQARTIFFYFWLVACLGYIVLAN